jgi:transcriptional regulator with XRE-family HTH domain
MLGIKQEGLALELGEDWNQRKISLLEQKEVIEEELLAEVAKVLKVPVEAIKNFDKEAAINVIGNNYHDNSTSNVNYHCTFNPIDKIVEMFEALMKSEKEKVELLQNLLDKKLSTEVSGSFAMAFNLLPFKEYVRKDRKNRRKLNKILYADFTRQASQNGCIGAIVIARIT